jgi:tight adherence protein C
MATENFLLTLGFLGSPLLFGVLLSAAAGLAWMAFAPARPAQQVQERLEGYLDRVLAVEEAELRDSFGNRVVLPGFQRLIRSLGRLAPQKSMATMQEMLVQAGEPGGLSALDFAGLRLLVFAVLGGGALLFFAGSNALPIAVRNAAALAVFGYMAPGFWLRQKVKRRQHEVRRALPDALDMLSIGVEAGLAFESALLVVGERWNNALSREFRRAVAEMRVGMSREEALQRMADRCGTDDLNSFVAVLIQSAELGVSISLVLHTQAAEMRTKRRQRAEALARQAGIKMTFPLVFLIFPALFAVILGPAIPQILGTLGNMGGSPK